MDHNGTCVLLVATAPTEMAAAGSAPDDFHALLAADEGRMLLRHVPGEDCYGADPAARDEMVAVAHRIQTRAAAHTGELLGRGVPDLRGPALARAALPVERPAFSEFQGRLRTLGTVVVPGASCARADPPNQQLHRTPRLPRCRRGTASRSSRRSSRC